MKIEKIIGREVLDSTLEPRRSRRNPRIRRPRPCISTLRCIDRRKRGSQSFATATKPLYGQGGATKAVAKSANGPIANALVGVGS